MHQYEWDTETGGLLLKPQQSKASNEPRPVYYREMNLLGMDKRWSYPQNDDAPIMFAEAERYIYRGRIVAKTRGGNLYAAPEVIYTEGVDGEPEGATLQAVDVATMVNKNAELMDHLVEETAKKIYSTYRHYQSKVDLFYVAFSGGKDSVVALDMVQRTLPHESFKVVFGDTQMEFPDTYDNVAKVEAWCTTNNIGFFRAKSKLKPQQTWACFGPPATDLRWCCSIHKTTPQILLLRHLTGKQNFTGMAFTGIRADESVARSQYEDVSEGKKHQGQYSCHVILDWNSAELYLHILRNNLPIGQSYYKGIPRAGCLVCPNAVGRSDYFRRKAYTAEIDAYLDVIRKTSAKNGIFSEEQMTDFIRNGNWRTRRTGRELNFGKDLFYYQQIDEGTHRYTIVKEGTKERLLSWFRTIGDTLVTSNESVQILLDGKLFEVKCGIDSDGYDCIEVSNCHKTKVDIKFLSLVRSCVIKAIYCVSCGLCEAECKNGCISCSSTLKIGNNCIHCHSCHDVHERCIRYYSIRNKEREGQGMEQGKMDRYYSFGFKESWLQSFIGYNGEEGFWTSCADGLAPNKRQDACHQFMLDAGLITGKYKKKKGLEIDYSPIQNTKLANVICRTNNTAAIWGLILVNLINRYELDKKTGERVYNPLFRWFVKTCDAYKTYETQDLIALLSTHPYFSKDDSGHMKQNVIDSLKIILATTPLGKNNILSEVDYTVKGEDKYTLNSVTRTSWFFPVPEVVLYALYMFAEACGDYYQFTLSYLMDETIEREGLSPTTIFGLDRETMIKVLNGLAINYPEFISVSFSFDLDTITLRKDKTAEDVLELF